MVFHALRKNKDACSNLFEIMNCAIESTKLIEKHENTIDKMGARERGYANEIATLKDALEEKQEYWASLEEELETLEESHNSIVSKRNHAIAKYKKVKKENVEFGVVHAKLTEDREKLDKAHKVLESEHSTLTQVS